MGNHMFKVQKLYLMEKSMKENGRMGNEMVKEHSLTLMMEESMKENGRVINLGTEQDTTRTETSLQRL